MFHRIIAVLMCLSVLGLAACNTVAGAGQDVQDAGKSMQHEADKAK